ncbi:sigma-70 family RNA polymerase sigma factor [Chitinophaga rhizosphaerae]|uniref:sigma-70 family RNA polymerase sigma factor n=1 Tax=Chitinophaga rhizosphaerae TaxID=1864947 RepID=UPI0013DFD189|nr:sigma-70 family RNA polymerase sigma factor [Chitinophaga rhizosphaerae]
MDSLLDNYQRTLFPYAYNILGIVEDAEDVVQDVMARFSVSDTKNVVNPKNYLIKSVINQAIQLKKKTAKIVSTDVWLPEPVSTEPGDDASNEVAGFSLLARLEQLNPKERAVFILKEGFGYSHEEIGDMLSYTTANSRKILSRSREKLKSLGYDAEIPRPDDVSATVRQLINAIRDSDTEAVKSLLAEGVQFYADGGNTVQVVAKHRSGGALVSGLLIFVHRNFNNRSQIVFTELNHQPAVLYFENGQLASCQIFEVSGDKVVRIDVVIDPLKLKHLQSTFPFPV